MISQIVFIHKNHFKSGDDINWHLDSPYPNTLDNYIVFFFNPQMTIFSFGTEFVGSTFDANVLSSWK